MWPSLEPGELRHRIQIQQQTSSPDGFGQPQPTWTTIVDAWARIEALSEKELYQNGQLTSQVSHTITLRYPAGATVTAGMRVTYGSHVYHVQAANNLEQRNTVLKLLVLEINAAA
jgi:SPP1 family predicted phage head-tail adaptor